MRNPFHHSCPHIGVSTRQGAVVTSQHMNPLTPGLFLTSPAFCLARTSNLTLINPRLSTMSIRCEAEHQTAICTSMGAGSEANDPGTVTETMTDFSSEDLFKAVTVTAGLEKLTGGSSGGAVTQPTQAASSSSGSSSSGNGAASAAASPSSGGAAPTSTTSVGGAAVPQITQRAVLAGVAALVGGAMAL